MVAGLTQLWTVGIVNIYLPGKLCGLTAARLAGVTSDPLIGSSQEDL